MKRAFIVLATVVTATLISQDSEKSVASAQVPPSLIGIWLRGEEHVINGHNEKLDRKSVV